MLRNLKYSFCNSNFPCSFGILFSIKLFRFQWGEQSPGSALSFWYDLFLNYSKGLFGQNSTRLLSGWVCWLQPAINEPHIQCTKQEVACWVPGIRRLLRWNNTWQIGGICWCKPESWVRDWLVGCISANYGPLCSQKWEKITYCSWLFGIEITDGIIWGLSSKLSEKMDCDTGGWCPGLSALPALHNTQEN